MVWKCRRADPHQNSILTATGGDPLFLDSHVHLPSEERLPLFVYIDESGHPHPNDHPRPVDVGVCLKREDVRHIAGALHRFSEDFRASIGGSATLRRDEREGKATAFLSRKAILGRWRAKRVYVDSVRNLPTTLRHMTIQFSEPSFRPLAGSAPSAAVTGIARLIQTSAGSSAALGGPPTKRLGRAA